AGSLPYLVLVEIFSEIEENSPNRYQTLFSCSLVNRYWCRHALPFLWRRPFNCRPENYAKLISIYLQFIDPDDLTLLDLDITLPSSSPSSLLLHYPTFIKHIDFCHFFDAVQRWMTTDADFKKGKNRWNWKPQWFHREIPISQEVFSIIKRGFVDALLLSFIKSGARVNSIAFSPQNNEMCLDEVLWPFEENVNELVGNVNSVSISGMFQKEQVFEELAKVCNNVQNMEVTIEGNADNYGAQLPTEYIQLGNLIQSQKNLISLDLTLREKNREFIDLLLPSIWCTASTLKHLRLCTADFRNVRQPLFGLATCNKLESLEFRYCKGLTNDFVAPFVGNGALKKLEKVRVLGSCCSILASWSEEKCRVAGGIMR
ncbi:5201_t:CDS:2, partial [Ambispora leptoticha]